MKPLPHPSSSIFMFLFTLVILTNIPTSLLADDSKYKDCYDPLSCGSVTDLTYPFWGESRPESCGVPNLKITCDNGVPKFTVDPVTYRILGWNLLAQSLTVARDDYWSNLCLTDYKNDTLDKTVFKYDDGNIVNVTLLYSCNGTAPYTPLQDCSQVSVVPQNMSSTYGSCKSVVVPFPKAQVQVAYSNNLSAIQSVLQEGIGLKWPQSYDECSKCYESNGTCGYEDGGFICYCEDGSSNKISCSGSENNNTTPDIEGCPQTSMRGAVKARSASKLKDATKHRRIRMQRSWDDQWCLSSMMVDGDPISPREIPPAAAVQVRALLLVEVVIVIVGIASITMSQSVTGNATGIWPSSSPMLTSSFSSSSRTADSAQLAVPVRRSEVEGLAGLFDDGAEGGSP